MSELSEWKTWNEIVGQPRIWSDWSESPTLLQARDWVRGLDVDEIWLCGAGTSAFVGEILAAALEGQPGPKLRAVASTDLVSRPAAYLNAGNPLIVNFGRSGNSAETIGTLDALDALAPTTPRLNITCNSESSLATRSSEGEQMTICLPPETHDQGFAMTSSFTTMLLTVAVAVGAVSTSHVASAGRQLHDLLPEFKKIAAEHSHPHARAVFLGSGPLTFAARECALKVMELAGGQVPSLWDSTLGFRHGPKSFVTDDTAIFVFLSSDPHSIRYDNDVVAELRDQFPNARVLSIGPGGDIPLPAENGDLINTPLAVVFFQLLAVCWSHALGLNVDDPFKGKGTLTRVVASVKLYEVSA